MEFNAHFNLGKMKMTRFIMGSRFITSSMKKFIMVNFFCYLLVRLRDCQDLPKQIFTETGNPQGAS